jgi:hypothetical protein
MVGVRGLRDRGSFLHYLVPLQISMWEGGEGLWGHLRLLVAKPNGEANCLMKPFVRRPSTRFLGVGCAPNIASSEGYSINLTLLLLNSPRGWCCVCCGCCWIGDCCCRCCRCCRCCWWCCCCRSSFPIISLPTSSAPAEWPSFCPSSSVLSRSSALYSCSMSTKNQSRMAELFHNTGKKGNWTGSTRGSLPSSSMCA